jgi:hypothetical protein
MNPGKLNHRIQFALETSVPNTYGGVSISLVPVVCSETVPTDVTWGDLQPIRQYHQSAIEAGANVMNGDKVLKIRYRKMFYPTKGMIFYDLNNPGDTFTVHAILPYDPGTKSAFQSNQSTVYKDQIFIFILGIKRV